VYAQRQQEIDNIMVRVHSLVLVVVALITVVLAAS